MYVHILPVGSCLMQVPFIVHQLKSRPTSWQNLMRDIERPRLLAFISGISVVGGYRSNKPWNLWESMTVSQSHVKHDNRGRSMVGVEAGHPGKHATGLEIFTWLSDPTILKTELSNHDTNFVWNTGDTGGCRYEDKINMTLITSGSGSDDKVGIMTTPVFQWRSHEWPSVWRSP